MMNSCALHTEAALLPAGRPVWRDCSSQASLPYSPYSHQQLHQKRLSFRVCQTGEQGCFTRSARHFPHRWRRLRGASAGAFSGSLGGLASDDDDEDSEALETTKARVRPRSVQDLDELSPSAKARIAQFVRDDYDLTSTSYSGESEDEASASSNGRLNGALHYDSSSEGPSSGKELGYQVSSCATECGNVPLGECKPSETFGQEPPNKNVSHSRRLEVRFFLCPLLPSPASQQS